MTALEVYNHTGQLLRAIAAVENNLEKGIITKKDLQPEYVMHLKNKANYEKANKRAEAQLAEELKEWYK